MNADVWKRRDVATGFLDGRSLMIPDRRRQLEVLSRVLRANPVSIRRVLDLGTGDGLLLGAVLDEFPAAGGVALDVLFDAAWFDIVVGSVTGFELCTVIKVSSVVP